ncbi:DUF6883 domain-containing protein [Spirosoma sp. KUDC1026]|uniref:DUF6883 domain-containing protein n=1 Tax=Spirosoma sp. KUDC1026 TaxID=2745947 RepID=UPI00397D7800
MKLEPPIRIDSRKITHYLLVPLPRSDKSAYLNRAGYTVDNWRLLEQDLLQLAASEEAIFEEEDRYGPSFSIIGELIGPVGRPIMVKTIWKRDIDEEITKFITLLPQKRA